jgi:hypothetical protein
MLALNDVISNLVQQKLTLQLDWQAAGQPLTGLVRVARDASREQPGAMWVCPLGAVAARPGSNTEAVGTACVEHTRLKFQTTILSTTRALWLSETVSAEGWLISRPAGLTMAEQRRVPRVTLSDSAGGVYGKLTGGGKEISSRMWDISATGASFVCMTDAGVNRMTGTRQVVQVFASGKQIELPGRVVYVRALSSRTSRVGIELDRTASELSAERLDEVVLALAERKKIPMVLPWREALRKAG